VIKLTLHRSCDSGAFPLFSTDAPASFQDRLKSEHHTGIKKKMDPILEGNHKKQKSSHWGERMQDTKKEFREEGIATEDG